MSLVTPAIARQLLNTSMSDQSLQAQIGRIEAQINAQIGEPWGGDNSPSTLTLTKRGGSTEIFLPTSVHAITSIIEDGQTVSESGYQIWLYGVVERLPTGARWGQRVQVTYQPVDDRLQRTQVIIDLLRLTLERTALKQESVAGEYSYTAPDNWDAEFRRAMKRLTFQAV